MGHPGCDREGSGQTEIRQAQESNRLVEQGCEGGSKEEEDIVQESPK